MLSSVVLAALACVTVLALVGTRQPGPVTLVAVIAAVLICGLLAWLDQRTGES